MIALLTKLNNVKGSFADFGFGSGKLSNQVYQQMKNGLLTKRDFHIYSNTEGFRDLSSYDVTMKSGESKGTKGRAIDIFHQVKQHLKKESTVSFGSTDSINELPQGKIAIAIIQSVAFKDADYLINLVWPKLTNKGILILPGYSKHLAIKKVVEFFIKRNSSKFDFDVVSSEDFSYIIKKEKKKVLGYKLVREKSTSLF